MIESTLAEELRRLRELVDQATRIALSAIKVIEDEGIDDDEESADARADIKSIRKKAGLAP